MALAMIQKDEVGGNSKNSNTYTLGKYLEFSIDLSLPEPLYCLYR